MSTPAPYRQINIHKHTVTLSWPALPHVYTHKSTIWHKTVANHRTKGGSSQQAFPLISYRRQQGGTTVSFVKPGRRYSSIASRGWKSNTSTKLHLSVCLSASADIRPSHWWRPVAARHWKALICLKDVLAQVKARRRKWMSVTALETKTLHSVQIKDESAS